MRTYKAKSHSLSGGCRFVAYSLLICAFLTAAWAFENQNGAAERASSEPYVGWASDQTLQAGMEKLALKYEVTPADQLSDMVSYEYTDRSDKLLQQLAEEHVKHAEKIKATDDLIDVSAILTENGKAVGGYKGYRNIRTSEVTIDTIVISPDVLDKKRAIVTFIDHITEASVSWQSPKLTLITDPADTGLTHALARFGFFLDSYQPKEKGMGTWTWSLLMPPTKEQLPSHRFHLFEYFGMRNAVTIVYYSCDHWQLHDKGKMFLIAR